MATIKYHLIIILMSILVSCGKTSEEVLKDSRLPQEVHISSTEALKNQPFISQPEWAKNAIIYEVNVRQYSPQGTLQGVTEDLVRIQSLGVDVIWLMPIFPIGEKNKKGTLGSYYSISDYQAVNPAMGTLEDLKKLVKTAHSMGMKVILDWVANHTAWDHKWIAEDLNRYTADSLGQRPMIPQGTDWTDTAKLDYSNTSTREAMQEAMQYWLKEADIDGYRCDVAGMVPLDFWIETYSRLSKIKPIFMLAEGGTPEMHKAFNMTYAWDFLHLSNEVAKGNKKVNEIEKYMEQRDSLYQDSDLLMYFTTNHDENSWNGTVFERYGVNYKNWAVMTFTLDGMPLIYSGQEVGLDHRLAFFEKDPISWEDKDHWQDFYRRLIQLHKTNAAFWSANERASLRFIPSQSEEVLIYMRKPKAGGKPVVVIINMGNSAHQISSTTFAPIIPQGATIKELLDQPIVSSQGVYIVPPHENRIFSF